MIFDFALASETKSSKRYMVKFIFFNKPQDYHLTIALKTVDFDKAVRLLETRLNTCNNPVESLVPPSTYHKLNRSASLLNFHRQNSLVHKSIEPDNHTPHHSNSLERRDSNASIKSNGSLPNLSRAQSAAHVPTFQRPDTSMTASFKKEVEEQLGDTLYKRAQAKLMIEADPKNIEAALADVMKVVNFLELFQLLLYHFRRSVITLRTMTTI